MSNARTTPTQQLALELWRSHARREAARIESLQRARTPKLPVQAHDTTAILRAAGATDEDLATLDRLLEGSEERQERQRR